MFLWLPYFSPKSFGLFYIWLLVCFRVTPSQLLIEISFVVLECPFFVCIVSSFVDISLVFVLWPVLSGFFPQVLLLFLPHVACYFFLIISVPLFLIIRACFRSFSYLRFQSNFPSRYYYYYYYYYLFSVFQTSVNRWFLTGVWILVFSPIIIMINFTIIY